MISRCIKTNILDASCSVDLRLFAISSVLAIIVYIVLILASMQSVNLFTALLYVSTLSAAIDDICFDNLIKCNDNNNN